MDLVACHRYDLQTAGWIAQDAAENAVGSFGMGGEVGGKD
jgi:hypothetical protein